MTSRAKNRRTFLLVIAALAVAVALPSISNGYVRSLAYSTVLFVGLSYGWNLISGYAGYLSFGQMTFFGIGAYSVALGVTRLHLPWFACAAVGGVLSAALAVPLGFLMLRLRGPFFALGMLGLAQTVRIATDAAASVTGGSSGIYLPPGSNVFEIYYWTLAVAVAAILTTYLIDRSGFGLRLRALREDEGAAATLGVNVTGTKVSAFVLSAVVPGLLGGGYAWYLTYVEPRAMFSTQIELQSVAMTILGGAGTVWGPLIGGVLMSQISELLRSTFPQYHLMVFGGLLVMLLIVLPRGIVPTYSRVRKARQR